MTINADGTGRETVVLNGGHLLTKSGHQEPNGTKTTNGDRQRPPLKVVIVGGGIGGISAAIANRLAGHSVTVLELEPKIQEVGAGIQLSANVTRILTEWGVAQMIADDVVEPRQWVMRRWQDGRKIGSLDMGPTHRAKYGGYPYWNIHRHDLITALNRRAHDLGVDVQVDAKVVEIDFENASVVVQSRQGSRRTVQGDLIIGADGLNSMTRRALVPTDEPEYTGDQAFRVVLDVADLDPVADADLIKMSQNPQVNAWLGPSHHVILYVLKGGRQLNIVAVAPDDLPEGLIRAPLSKAETMKKYENWDPILCRLLAATKGDEIWRWKLHKRPALEQWSHPSGKFVLMGDAAHPTLPYVAQGAAMAIEDAAMLGHLLRDTESIGAALTQYESLRRPRTTRVVGFATRQKYWNHLPDGEEQERRDAMMGAEVSPEGDPFLFREPTLSSFLYGYDVHEAIKEISAKSS